MVVIKIRHNYITNPKFDHKDELDNEYTQEVIFEYKKHKSESIEITTKRNEVEKVTISTRGLSDYSYGEEFDVSKYNLYITYKHKNNVTIPLTKEMVDLEDNIVKPEKLGDNYFNFWFNGVKSDSSIILNVTKGEQVLKDEQLTIIDLTEDKIKLSEIPNAVYAVLPKDKEVTEEDFFTLENSIYDHKRVIREDLIVYAKLPASKYYEESNVITLDVKYIEKTKQPVFYMQVKLIYYLNMMKNLLVYGIIKIRF